MLYRMDDMTHNEGEQVIPTERILTTSLSLRTGSFARLGGSHGGRGGGAPKIAPTPAKPHGRLERGHLGVGQKSFGALAVALLVALTFSAGVAGANQTRVLQQTFGSASTETQNVADPFPLSDPHGVAVDTDASSASEGDVYVADTGNNRVEKFGPNGEFLLMFGKEVGPLGEDTCTFSCKSAGVLGSEPGAFEHVQFVAVDPTSGDVYVADTGDSVVSKFSPEGVLEATWGNNGTGGAANGQLNGSGTTPFDEIAGIAVNANGTLYVLDKTFVHFESPGKVFEFEPSSKLQEVLELKEEARETSTPVGLGVNGAGDLFTAKPFGTLIEFASTGGEIADLYSPNALVMALSGGPEGGIYFAGSENTLGHEEFVGAEVVEPGGRLCREVCSPTDSLAVGFVGSGIGVNASRDTFLVNEAEGKVYEYGPLATIPGVEEPEEATEIEPTSARLNGQVNPEGQPVTECVFEYGETKSYGQTTPCAQTLTEINTTLSSNDTLPASVSATIAGLTPGVTYHFRLIARDASDPGPKPVSDPGADKEFETLPPPAIDSATVSGLSSSTATLNTRINPGGTETHYYFEYDTRPYAMSEGEHGEKTNEGTIPAGKEDVAVDVQIDKLEPGRPYYWRIVATNEAGTTTSVEHTFVYRPGGAGLPDGRAYEMVTPAHKNGSLIGDVSFIGNVTSIGEDGSQVIAPAIQCFGEVQSCKVLEANSVGSPYEFTRTPKGWVTTPLSPSGSDFPRNTSWEYNASTGAALFSMPTAPDNEDDFYLRDPGSGAFSDIGPISPPEDGELGNTAGTGAATSADESHIAWEIKNEGAFTLWPGLETIPGNDKVYEYAYDGARALRPFLVGVTGQEGSDSLVGGCGAHLGRGVWTMSANGRTVFFTAACPPAETVYARVDGESADAQTIAISDPSPSACGEGTAPDEVACREAEAKPRNAIFEGASENGSRAFFLSLQQLTDSASEDSNERDNELIIRGHQSCFSGLGANGCNLYEYEGVTSSSASDRRLVDVSAADGGVTVANGPQVQGIVALSGDGSHVYFVAKGKLTEAERPGCMAEWQAAGRAKEADCRAVEGADNLYVYSDETRHASFIADLPTSDEAAWKYIPGFDADVTPEGRYIVLPSHGQLTADDTSRSGAQQLFRYDAQTGRLVRLSIGNDGFDDDGNRSAPTPCYEGGTCAEDVRIALRAQQRADPTMSNDGKRVFFTSPVGLTPGALEDATIGFKETPSGELHEWEPVYARNVYEWEQEGVGSCPPGHSAGCVFLISDGKDVNVNAGAGQGCAEGGEIVSAVCLLGADAEGKNVFFTTTDRMTGQDTNSELDYYDARMCEPEHGNPCIQVATPPQPPCDGEECHGIPAGVPGVPNAPTTTFKGQGNLTPSLPTRPVTETRAGKLTRKLATCRQKYKQRAAKRRKCEATARARYGWKMRPNHKSAEKKGAHR